MYPGIFSIETVLGCNLACLECAVGAGLVQRKAGRMAFDTYRRIAERIREYCRYLYLHLWGEPMLNQQICAMIRHASAFARVNISTNASTLDAALAEELVLSGVAEIIVSIDGMTQEVYAAYRRKGNLKRALEGLVWLQKYNLVRDRRVQISPQFIVFKHNQHEMEIFAKFCRGLGLKPAFKAPYLRNGSVLKNSDLPQFQRRIAVQPPSRIANMRACPNARDVFTILLDGSVVACCYDHNGVTCFGNILQNSVAEIWRGDAFVQFRNNLILGRGNPFCLTGCLLY